MSLTKKAVALIRPSIVISRTFTAYYFYEPLFKVEKAISKRFVSNMLSQQTIHYRSQRKQKMFGKSTGFYSASLMDAIFKDFYAEIN